MITILLQERKAAAAAAAAAVPAGRAPPITILIDSDMVVTPPLPLRIRFPVASRFAARCTCCMSARLVQLACVSCFVCRGFG
jgi:hypothetical protein